MKGGHNGSVYLRATTNGVGVVSHVGTVLLAEVADRFGLTAAFAEAMSGTRRRSGGHDPGRVLVDLAVAIADGAETITDLRVMADQQRLHGRVASLATAWRVLKSVDDGQIGGVADRPGRGAGAGLAGAGRADRAGVAAEPGRGP